MRTTADRLGFLKKLDEADQVRVTDWESRFIESNLSNGTLSSKQEAVIDTMIDKYADRIGWTE